MYLYNPVLLSSERLCHTHSGRYGRQRASTGLVHVPIGRWVFLYPHSRGSGMLSLVLGLVRPRPSPNQSLSWLLADGIL